MPSDRPTPHPLGLLALLAAGLLTLGGCSILMLPIRLAASAVDAFIQYFPLFGLFAASQPVDVPPSPEPAVHASAELAPLDSLAAAIPEGESATLYLIDPGWASAATSDGPLGRAIADRHEQLTPVGLCEAAPLVNDPEEARRFVEELQSHGIRLEAIGPAAEAFLARAR